MHLLKFLVLPFMLQLRQTLVDGYNYCHDRNEYCRKHGMEHFICNINKQLKPFQGTTKLVGLVPETLRTRSAFITYHNKFRNRLAGGELMTYTNKTFPKALRMRAVIWDAELAYFARLHVASVSFKHTLCRSAGRFPHVGENLGLVMPSEKKKTLTDILDMTLKEMFKEYLQVPEPDAIVNAFDSTTDTEFGHFTVVASDRVSRLGCAIAAATDCSNGNEHGQHCHFVTCYYDFTNMEDSFVYKMGTKVDCEDWGSSVSSEYPNLCTNDGKIFDMNHGNTYT